MADLRLGFVCATSRRRIGTIANSLFAALASAGLAFSAAAQESIEQAPEVVVSASRVTLPAKEVGSAVTVITAEDIERRQVRLVSDVLRDVPGLAVNRSGGVGSLTQVRIRGAEANHTLVIIDGIEVNDPSGGSEFDLANLLAADVERVEILRGPQSALYGSDAIGGVINIVTKKGKRGVEAAANGEAGSFRTYQAAASLRGGFEEILNLGFGVTRYKTSGISAADEDNGNDENDAYRNFTANGSVTFKPIGNLEVGAVGRLVRSEAESDDFVGGIGAVDANNETETRQRYGRAYARVTLFDKSDWASWEHIVSAAYTEDKSNNFSNEVLTGEFDGFKTKYDYQTNLFLFAPELAQTVHTLTFLIEREDESVEASSAFVDVDRDISTTSVVGEYRIGAFDRLFLSGSVRRDDNDKLFDDETTFRTTAAYVHHETGTRLHGSYGTGVKNPTIFELFGFAANFTGNPNLRPEESRGWDIGLEQSLFEDRVLVDVTYFDNRIRNLIIGAGNTAINLAGTTKIRGVEVTARARIVDGPDFVGSYTWTLGEDASGTELVRRPKHIASANLNYRFQLFGHRGSVNLGVRYNGEQNDFFFDPSFTRSVVRLDDFTLVNFAATYEVHHKVEIFARVENLLDEDYQEVFTFGAPGIAGFAGLRVEFGPVFK